MKLYTETQVLCPHCGHHTPVGLDTAEDEVEFYQDCIACCNSIHFRLIRDHVRNKRQLLVDADDEQIF